MTTVDSKKRSTFSVDQNKILKEESSEYEYELRSEMKNNTLRKSYITKLLSKRVWDPTKRERKTHNSIFIYDWDDTFFCTSYLSPTGLFSSKYVNIDKKDQKIMSKIEDLAVDIISRSIEKGEVYIITNAAPGWVEYSTSTYYKKLYPLIQKVNIVSARGLYEKQFPDDSKRWKVEAFLNIQTKIDLRLVTNFICMGDSQNEIEAGNIFTRNFDEIYIKSIKFRENPKPEDLVKQLKLVKEQFPTIYSSPKNLTIKVEKKEK